MNTEYLEYLLVVADSKSINEAAQKLFITRQSLNSAITKLEKELSLKIFDRSYTGITVTPEGEIVLSAARNILNTINNLKKIQISDKHSAPFDTINIYVSPVLNFYFTQHIYTNLYEKHIYANLQTLDNDWVLKYLNNNTNADGIYFLNIFNEKDIEPFKNNNSLIYEHLMTDSLLVILSTDHELTRYKSISVNTLAKYTLASLQSLHQKELPYRSIFNDKQKITAGIQTDNIFTFVNTIEKGMAVSPISTFSYKHSSFLKNNPKITSLKLKSNIPFQFCCIYSKKYYASHRNALDVLLNMIKEL